MAHLRAPDDEVAARFRQKPRGTIPQGVHPGQQPPLPGASSPISPSASEQRNRDAERAQEQGLHESTVKPQRVDPKDSPLFTSSGSGVAEAAREMRVQQHQHTAGVTPITHPGHSSTQSPSDAGHHSGGAA